MNEYQRFCKALQTVDGYTDCERCPIAEQCQAFSDELSPEDSLKPEYSCEALLFRYVMTGETPSK